MTPAARSLLVLVARSCSPAAARSRQRPRAGPRRARRRDAAAAREAPDRAGARRADRHRADRLRHPRPGLRPVLDGRQARRSTTPHKQTGAAVSYRAPDTFSIERMRRYIDEAVADRPDGLVVSLPDATALAPSIKAAVKAGIPVDHDQLRQRRVPQARRARPRRPARVRGGPRGRASGWARAGVKRALCVNQENGNAGLDQRCRGLRATACAKTGGTMRALPVAAAGPGDRAAADGRGARPTRRGRRHPHARPGRRASPRSTPSAPAASSRA